MKTPKFTDTHRFVRPYRHAKDTDISKAFAAERKRLAELLPDKTESNVRNLAEAFRGTGKK